MFAERGAARLVEVAAGVHAYLQQGSWGFSNAGLVASGTSSLLVDTLYDLTLTEQMLAAMRRVEPAAARIRTVVNTHANGDHCWGNQLVGAAEIVSSRAAAEEMLELRPFVMRALMEGSRRAARLPAIGKKALGLLGRLGVPHVGSLADAGDFVEECFGAFDFRGIRLTPPRRTFEGRLSLDIGDKRVELIQVGPAHTKGDVIAFLPAERVVFTGDILFVGSHPVAWEGPIGRWLLACDLLLDLDADTFVPGHGPLTTKDGVRQTKAYWQEVQQAAARGYASGFSADEVARHLAAEQGFAEWTEAHRLVVNVDTAYRELAGDRGRRDPVEMFARMARLETIRAAANGMGGIGDARRSARTTDTRPARRSF
jgi:glyoxylase-like metal-dependent hydrolase (beta-lactamase superfamily II)